MAYVLNVDIVDEDGSIHVTHHFWGETEQEVRGYFEAHQNDCDYLDDALEDGRVVEELKQIPEDQLPQVESEDGDEDGDNVYS